MLCAPSLSWQTQDDVRRHRDAIDKADLESQAKEEEENEEEEEDESNKVEGKTALHVAAAYGSLEEVRAILTSFESGSIGDTINYDMIHARDANDFQAVHEAAVGGHLDVLKYLLENGADLNAFTKDGGNVLWWAKQILRKDDPVVLYLVSIGAVETATPMLE